MQSARATLAEAMKRNGKAESPQEGRVPFVRNKILVVENDVEK
jgi:hypothetical protein